MNTNYPKKDVLCQTLYNLENKEIILSRQNSETNIKLVTAEDFHKQDPSRFLILPKRRADSNTVYGFGIKHVFNKDKQIVKDMKNNNYFKFDYNILKTRIRNDPILRERLIKRILINKNLKKQYTLLEKPFPLLTKISNSKVVNKSEEFLMSLIMNHKFDIGEEILMELIDIRKNKIFDFCDMNIQKRNFLKTIDKNIEEKLKNEDGKKPSSNHLVDSKKGNLTKKRMNMNEYNNYDSEDEISNNTREKDYSKNRINLNNINDFKYSKSNFSEENKNDFFLISSNFDKLKTKKFNKRGKARDEIDLSQKQEQELIHSLDFDFNKFKYETADLNIRECEIEKKEINANPSSNLIYNVNSDLSGNICNNTIIRNKGNLNENSNFSLNRNKTVVFNITKISKSSKKNLLQVNSNLSSPDINSQHTKDKHNNHIIRSKSNSNVLNSNNNNNIEGSIYHRTNIFKNISTFNPNLIMNNLSKKDKDDSRSKNKDSSCNTENFIIFHDKYKTKTLSTENDFRKFNKNVINKIINLNGDSKKINKDNIKPDFSKYKYPEETKKFKDPELEKIKMFANRKNKSSQIKSRIFGQPQIDINTLNKYNHQTDISDYYETSRNFFSNIENDLNGKKKNFTETNNFSLQKIYSNNSNSNYINQYTPNAEIKNDLIMNNSNLSFVNKKLNFIHSKNFSFKQSHNNSESSNKNYIKCNNLSSYKKNLISNLNVNNECENNLIDSEININKLKISPKKNTGSKIFESEERFYSFKKNKTSNYFFQNDKYVHNLINE